jgi:hypothetical protein
MKRVDSNQQAIVKALRACGASVEPRLSQVGHGVPDLLVGFRGVNLLMEVKDGDKSESRRRLTPDEQEWIQTWRGQYVIVNSVEDAVRVLNDAGGRTAGPLWPMKGQ